VDDTRDRAILVYARLRAARDEAADGVALCLLIEINSKGVRHPARYLAWSVIADEGKRSSSCSIEEPRYRVTRKRERELRNVKARTQLSSLLLSLLDSKDLTPREPRAGAIYATTFRISEALGENTRV